MSYDDHDDDSAEIDELRRQLAEAKDDYDLLGKFFIVSCAMNPEIGVTPTQAYLTLMTRGAREMKTQIMAFVMKHQHLLNKKEGNDEHTEGTGRSDSVLGRDCAENTDQARSVADADRRGEARENPSGPMHRAGDQNVERNEV